MMSAFKLFDLDKNGCPAESGQGCAQDAGSEPNVTRSVFYQASWRLNAVEVD